MKSDPAMFRNRPTQPSASHAQAASPARTMKQLAWVKNPKPTLPDSAAPVATPADQTRGAEVAASAPKARFESSIGAPESINGSDFGSRASAACGTPPRRAYPPQRSCGRVAEGGGLLNRYRVVKPYRGFESLRLRQNIASACFCPHFKTSQSPIKSGLSGA
jgi:hypothetical protein